MRPAVSVGGATALDELDASHHLDHLTALGHVHGDNYLDGYFDAPDSLESDHYLAENGVLAIPDTFNLNYDPLALNHDGITDDFDLAEFLNNDEPTFLASDLQSSRTLVE